MSPQNDHIFIFFVLVRVRKCVELFYWNWPGLTLSSPIRFSSADRRTKSIIWNVEWREKKCKKMTNMTCYPTLSTHKMLDFSSLLVLVRVRKCVELFSPNWRGLTLSSPIRFSSADRRTKSMICNAVPSCGSDRLKLHFREGSVADISQNNSTHFRTCPSTKNEKMWPFWGLFGRCQQLTPPENVVLGDHFHNSEQHVIFVF